MDSQSLSTSSKCSSSDFSIKRILGEPCSSEDPQDSPSWLCCTRYQPPRLPRANISGSRVRRSGRHARVPFTGAQSAALEAAYARAPYLAPPALRALAAALQLRDDRIKIWFQNRRARERREKNGNITPPRAIPLQPTATPRVSPNIDLAQSWRLHSDGGNNVSPMEYTTRNVDLEIDLGSNIVTSESYAIVNNTSQSVFNESDDSMFVNDNDRSESPLDIETVDS